MLSRPTTCTRHRGLSHVYSDAQKQVNRCNTTRRRSNGMVISQIAAATGKSRIELSATNPQKTKEPICFTPDRVRSGACRLAARPEQASRTYSVPACGDSNRCYDRVRGYGDFITEGSLTMDWWIWVLIVLLVVAAAFGVFLWVQSRRRVGGVIATNDHQDKGTP